MNINKSHLTAISRKKLPVPTRWLMEKNLLVGRVLDYGCGKCSSINPASWSNYDPFYAPIDLTNLEFHSIVCNYVLNTLHQSKVLSVVKDIQKLLTDDGVAYISVRTDVSRYGSYTKKDTYQHLVELPLEIVKKCASFRIYKLTKCSKL